MLRHQKIQQFEVQLLQLQKQLLLYVGNEQWPAVRHCDQQICKLVTQIEQSGLRAELSKAIQVVKAQYAAVLQQLQQQQSALATLLQQSTHDLKGVSAYQQTLNAVIGDRERD